MILTIPGMVDPHVHLRDLDWAHKSTFDSETAAALAGGYWAVFDMPNTPPTTTTRAGLDAKLNRFAAAAHCDYGVYFGADQRGNQAEYPGAAPDTIGMKIYCNETTGNLLIADSLARQEHALAWHEATGGPMAVHAEGETVTDLLDIMWQAQGRLKMHFCHISTREEVEQLRRAKRSGGYGQISVGVCPHHLYLTQEDLPRLGPFGRMKPELKTRDDAAALWEGVMDGTVDVIESDHAPHTRAEKESDKPPFGVPGLETTLPLMGLAVHEGRITPERLIALLATNAQRIFGITPPPETTTTVDLSASSIIDGRRLRTAPGWSPFEGMRVWGAVREVRIRGQVAYDGEQVLTRPGSGRNVAHSAEKDRRA
ncbi:MAG: dihydroorotase family protein [Chloroflexi bacterium]|nr:dihydroorotase family protein [Chloroflexota bacterium]